MTQKNTLKLFLHILIIGFLATSAYAYQDRKDYFNRPQFGGWFGPVTPLGKLSDRVTTQLGGGIFVRYNLPYRYLKLGLDASYQNFTSKDVNDLKFVPFYGNVLYQLPIDFAVRFQFKAGVGGGWLMVLPDKKSGWDPIFMCGFEASFPAGRLVNIGLRIDYIYIYEGYLKGAKYGGHIMNMGIQLYFNI